MANSSSLASPTASPQDPATQDPVERKARLDNDAVLLGQAMATVSSGGFKFDGTIPKTAEAFLSGISDPEIRAEAGRLVLNEAAKKTLAPALNRYVWAYYKGDQMVATKTPQLSQSVGGYQMDSLPLRGEGRGADAAANAGIQSKSVQQPWQKAAVGRDPQSYAGSNEAFKEFYTRTAGSGAYNLGRLLLRGIGELEGSGPGTLGAFTGGPRGLVREAMEETRTWRDRYIEDTMVPEIYGAIAANVDGRRPAKAVGPGGTDESAGQEEDDVRLAWEHIRNNNPDGDKLLEGLVWEEINRSVDEEAKSLSFSTKAAQAFAVGAPELATFVFGPLRMALAGGKVAVGAASAAARLSGIESALLQGAPRLAKGLTGALRLSGTGATLGVYETSMPLSASERSFIQGSDDPDGERQKVLMTRFVGTVAAWPLYEVAGGFGRALQSKIIGKVGYMGARTNLGRRIIGGLVGGAGTSIGFSFIPHTLGIAQDPEQYENALEILRAVYEGTLDKAKLEDYAARWVGGIFAPFGLMHVAGAMRAYPGLHPESQRFLTETIDLAYDQVPHELKIYAGINRAYIAGEIDTAMRFDFARPVGELVNAAKRYKRRHGSKWEEKFREDVVGYSPAEFGPQAMELAIAMANGTIRESAWIDFPAAVQTQHAMAERVFRSYEDMRRAMANAGERQMQRQLGPGVGREIPAPRSISRPIGDAPPSRGPIELPGKTAIPPGPVKAPQEPPEQEPAATQPVPRRVEVAGMFRHNQEAIRFGQTQQSKRALMDAAERVMGKDRARDMAEKWDDVLDYPELDYYATDVLSSMELEAAEFHAESGMLPSGAHQARILAQTIKEELRERLKGGHTPPGLSPTVIEAQILRRVLQAMAGDPKQWGGTVDAFLKQNADRLGTLLMREAGELPAQPPAKDPYEPEGSATGSRDEINLLLRDALAQDLERRLAEGRGEEAGQAGGEGEEPGAAGPTGIGGGGPKGQPGAGTAEPAADKAAGRAPKEEAGDGSGAALIDSAPSGSAALRQLDGAAFYAIDLGGEPAYVGTMDIRSIKTHPYLQPRIEEGATGDGPHGTNAAKVRSIARGFEFVRQAPLGLTHIKEKPPEWEEWSGPGWYLWQGHHTYLGALARLDPATAKSVGLEIDPGAMAHDRLKAEFYFDKPVSELRRLAGEQNNARSKLSIFQTAAAVSESMERGVPDAEIEAANFARLPGWAQRLKAIHDLVRRSPRVADIAREGGFGPFGEDSTIAGRSAPYANRILDMLADAARSSPDILNAQVLGDIAAKIAAKGMRPGAAQEFVNSYVGVVEAERARQESLPQEQQESAQQGSLVGFEDVAKSERETLELLARAAQQLASAEYLRRNLTGAKMRVKDAVEEKDSPETREAGAITGALLQEKIDIAARRAELLKIQARARAARKLDPKQALDAETAESMEELGRLMQAAEDALRPEPGKSRPHEPKIEEDDHGTPVPADFALTDPHRGKSGDAGGKGDGLEPERPRGPEADAGERPGEAREAEVGKPAADDGKGAAAERGGKFGESNTVFSSERADAALEKLKKLLGPKTDPDEPVKFFAFGLDPEVIGPLADYAGYIIEGALRKTGRVLYSEFGQRMHKLLDQMLPEESQGTARDYAPYFGPLWDALRARPELAKYALPPAPVWKVPDRKGPNVWRELMEIEAENERKVREEDPDAADTSGKDQLTIDEQLRAKRDEEVDIALNGSRDPILEDQYQGEFPWAHDQVMRDPAFGELLDSHQKPAAKAIVRTLEAGSEFLLADGAGTGKTWTALAAALEMTTRHGGKVVVFTGTRTAIGQWTRKEFPLMGVDPETQVKRVEQIGDEGTRVAIDIKSTFQANLAHRLDPLKALIEKGVPGDPVEGETRPAGLNREVPVILVDEAHFAGTWHKAESKEHRARRFVAFTDWARERGVRMLYTTATPADEAPQLRYLSGLFTPKGTDLEFDNFMQTIGFNKSPHGKKRYEIDPRRSHEVTANLLLLRRKLALEGKMLNREMSYDGVETMFGRHELTPAEWGEWDATIDKYALLEDQLTRSGFGAVAGLVPAWRIGDQRRKSEAWKMADAVKWASSFREATDGNGRVIILTDYVNPAKVDKVHGMLSRPRTADGASALSRIAELYGPERAFEVEQMAKRLDFDSGQSPPTILQIREMLDADGWRTEGIHGTIRQSFRDDIAAKWHQNLLDAVVGNRDTIGESLSFHDTIDRPVMLINMTLPWTAAQLVQGIGRVHRLGATSMPTVVFLMSDMLSSERKIGDRLAGRLKTLRASVRGLESSPRHVDTMDDVGALWLAEGARARTERDGWAEDKARREERRGNEEQGEGAGITPDEAFTPKALRVFLGAIRDVRKIERGFENDVEIPGPRQPLPDRGEFVDFEHWQRRAQEIVDDLRQELPERLADYSAPLEDVMTSAERARAMSELGRLLEAKVIEPENRDAAEAYLATLVSTKATTAEGAVGGEGAPLRRGVGGGGESGALDMGVFAKMFTLEPLHHLAYALAKPEPLDYQMPSMPYRLRFGVIRRMLYTPTRILGWRMIEPFTENSYKSTTFMQSAEQLFGYTRKIASQGSGGERQFQDVGQHFVIRALNGERYAAEGDPMSERLGRREEYRGGSSVEEADRSEGGRYFTAEQEAEAHRNGLTAEQWLETQPTYKDLLKTDPQLVHLLPVFTAVETIYEHVRNLAAENSWAYRQAHDAALGAAAEAKWLEMRAESNPTPENIRAFEETQAKAEKLSEEAEGVMQGWGITDYYTHLFTDRAGRRWLPSHFKRQVPKEVYTRFLEGRTEWDTRFLNDLDVTFWTYMRSMVRAAYMTRAVRAVEPMVEGELRQVHWDGEGFRSQAAEGDPLYDRQGLNLNEMAVDRKARRVAAGMSATQGHRNDLLINGQFYDLRPVKRESGARGYKLIPQGVAGGRQRAGTLEVSAETLRGMFVQAKVGGLRQAWGEPGRGSSSAVEYYERYLEKLLGRREYSVGAKATDLLSRYLYGKALGFLNLPSATINLLGGAVMQVYQLGPLPTLKGWVDHSSGKYRDLLQEAGISTPAEAILTDGMSRTRVKGYSPSLAGRAASKAGYAYDKFEAAHMVLFNLAESNLRGSSFLAGYQAARRAGMDIEQAMAHGRRAVGRTQFHYDGTDTPMLWWSPAGRFFFHLGSWGARFFSVMGMDALHTARGMRDTLVTGDARPTDIQSYRRLLRGAVTAYATKQIVQLGTKGIQQFLWGDEEGEGMDVSYMFGTKFADIPFFDEVWAGLADRAEESLGIDIMDWVLPGFMLPQGPSMPMQLTMQTAGAVADWVNGDPDAFRRWKYQAGRTMMPTQLLRFMQLRDAFEEGSVVRELIDDAQAAVRGVPLIGDTLRPSVPNWGVNQAYVDKVRPYSVLDPVTGRVIYNVGGPQTWSRFLLPGADPRTTSAFHDRLEMMPRNVKRRAKREILREAAWELLDLQEHGGSLEEQEAVREQIRAGSIEFGVTVDQDFMRSAAASYPLRRADSRFRDIYFNTVDRDTAWHAMLDTLEDGRWTPLQVVEYFQALYGTSGEGFRRWATMNPEHAARLAGKVQSAKEQIQGTEKGGEK